MRKNIFYIFLFSTILFSSLSFTQDKPLSQDQSKIFYSIGDGSTENSIFTTIKPIVKSNNLEKQSLLFQLDKARLDGEIHKALSLQDELDRIDNVSKVVNPIRDPFAAGMLETEQHFTNTQEYFYSPDYFRSTIAAGGFWSVATFTSHRTPVLFSAVTQYEIGAGDQLKVFASYNNGVDWVLKGTYNGWSTTVDYRAGELDLEVIVNGPDTIAFVVAGYTFNSHAFTQIAKFNIGTGNVQSDYFSFGGALVDSVQTYNPKITSDHTIYSAVPFVMLTAARDSSIGGGNEKMYYMYAQISDPFASFNITYKQSNGSNGFWWHSSAPSSAYLWQDIAYARVNGQNRVYTVFNHNGSTTTEKRVYLAYSNNYGAEIAGSMSISDTTELTSAKIAATGGNANICIGFRRFYSPDWDFKCAYSTTGGDSLEEFTFSHPEYTSRSSKLIDLQSIKNSESGYVFSWVFADDSVMSYRRTNTGGLNYSTRVDLDELQHGDTRFGGIKAGYVNNSISDSSLVVWSGSNGVNAYCSYNLYTPVSVDGEENGMPFVYTLQQNYPNPFNPNTTIRFSVPEQISVKLKIFNAIGQEVATLINTELASGNHSVDFNAASLSSGVYFYRIETPNFTSTMKMILMK